MLIGCPRRLIVPGTFQMIKAARLADKGHWPIAGGWLDQANVLLEAVEYVWLCEGPYKEE